MDMERGYGGGTNDKLNAESLNQFRMENFEFRVEKEKPHHF